MLDLEDKYLKMLLPNSNNLIEGGSSFGYKHRSLSSKNKRYLYLRKTGYDMWFKQG